VVKSVSSVAPVLVLVGGFPGAGKTTLVIEAARRLAARGLRVAFVSNDQAGDLVDTALARAADLMTAEVAGGCFCCRLSDLLSATETLLASHPDVIFAEPVGSCLDLSATIVHPLLADHPGRFRLAPLTVLVDPVRAHALNEPGADADLTYLFAHQIDEADIVCYTKMDRGLAGPPLPAHVPLALSARTGEGVDDWLTRVLDVHALAGTRGLDVDYERYAIAEAALAWLNWQVHLTLDPPLSPIEVLGPMADRLLERCASAGAEIVHVKLLDQTTTGFVRVSLCGSGLEPTGAAGNATGSGTGNGADPAADGALDASPTRVHTVLVNARVRTTPATLSRIVHESLAPLAASVVSSVGDAFAPGPPRPERRIARKMR
jgi:hypothetical protein